MISNFDTIFYTLSFIVPGFISDSVLASIVPRRAEGKDTLFLRYFTLSCLNYALWVWLIYLLPRLEFFNIHPLFSALSWLIIIFVSPLILGLILGKQSRKGWVSGLLNQIGINPIHPIPTAWDFSFYDTHSLWVLVTLKDGSQVGGFFGVDSFASSDQNERDLYIQKIYRVMDEGPWQEIPNNKGILIKGNEIRNIEFWRD